MESADSIRSLYRHFLSAITQKSLTAFYYACSYSKADYSKFMNVTASLALKLIPDSLKSQPVFFCIDDTMISKFGRKFEYVSKLFGHAAHNGSNYLNGHCFVSLMLCVPIWSNRRIAYLAVPFAETAQEFILYKRSLGFKYADEPKCLSRFCRFSVEQDISEVEISRVLAALPV